MISKNYLFGPFVGETIYELNYFVGHAIYLRKQNPKNKIIVFTRKENFDLYGKYATTFLPLQLDEDLVPEKFSCKNMRPHFYDELTRRFSQKYKNQIKICDHFYPMVMTQLKNNKWYYPRDQIDFDFKPRSENKILVDDITINYENIILSMFNDTLRKFEKYFVFPVSYITKLNLEKRGDISSLGLIIEMIKNSKYVYADIDHVVGRLAMLLRKPLITQREFLDVQYLSPINPYESIVIGCENLEEGIKYLEANHENNI
jgi:hypothetical protein